MITSLIGIRMIFKILADVLLLAEFKTSEISIKDIK